MSEVKRKDEIQGEIIHEYDGIEEADNALPNWWLWIFYGSIVFSTVYWLALHEYGAAPLIAEEYAEAAETARVRAERAAGGPVTDDSLEALSHDERAVNEGKAKFRTQCVACHGDRAEGRIGPNLTDRYWIHGATPTAIHKVISKGAPGQPMMIAWERTLGKRATQQVAAYLLTLRDTNVPGKAPQGRTADGEEAPAAPSPAPAAAPDGGTAAAPAPTEAGTQAAASGAR